MRNFFPGAVAVLAVAVLPQGALAADDDAGDRDRPKVERPDRPAEHGNRPDGPGRFDRGPQDRDAHRGPEGPLAGGPDRERFGPEAIFKAWDRDNDGQLSLREFTAGAQRFRMAFGHALRESAGPGPRYEHGPADRGPADRGPADRGPADRGPGDRGPREHGPGDRGPENREFGGRPGPPELGPGAERGERHRDGDLREREGEPRGQFGEARIPPAVREWIQSLPPEARERVLDAARGRGGHHGEGDRRPDRPGEDD